MAACECARRAIPRFAGPAIRPHRFPRHVNPRLARLQPYPFERLRQLLAGRRADPSLTPINLSIGEPRHPTPRSSSMRSPPGGAGIANYPTTVGAPALREAIAAWLARRNAIAAARSRDRRCCPCSAAARRCSRSRRRSSTRAAPGATVVMPNPFYQIYEGAALLAGAEPWCVNADAARGLRAGVARRAGRRLGAHAALYVCSPDNPTGRVTTPDEWRRLFELSDRHGFVIASDECYSEIYFDEAAPPLGALAAAQRAGPRRLSAARRLRQPVEALERAGTALGLRRRRCRADQGLPALPHLSRLGDVAGRRGGEHRRMERRGARARQPRANTPRSSRRCSRGSPRVLPCAMPDAAFYLWARTPGDDAAFAQAAPCGDRR